MSDYKDRISAVRLNPALMQDVALNELERQLTGLGNYDVPDASNPWVFLMEASTLNTSVAISEGEAILRRLYPRMANTPEELYHHMADVDYIGRFATPAWTTFEAYILREEIIRKAVPTGLDGTRKLVIPRLSSFRVAGVPFTMQYPIEIRILSHGGMQIVYDTTTKSPIQTLDSNLVDWDIVKFPDGDVVVLRIPTGQFKVSTHTETLNNATGFNTRYSFTDQFYYARVYLSGPNRTWREIQTTHTDQVYDYTTPTAVLQVLGDKLNVKIPPIYFTSGLASGEIRIDIYTTHGRIELDPGSYQASQFSYELVGMDDPSTFVSPLQNFNQFSVLNPNYVSGGSNMMSFEDLRRNVINNALGTSQIPITNAQLENELQSRGYSVVTNIDNITNRQFLATRRLTPPIGEANRGAIGCMMGQIQTTMENISGSEHVIDNGSRLTIKPSMVYNYEHGVISPMLDHELSAVLAMSTEARIRHVNNNRYLYCPFHYVLDSTPNSFDARPYYMDRPEIIRKQFVGENNTSLQQMSADEYFITRIDGGYRLSIRTDSSDGIKELSDSQIIVQLGYRPSGENSYASVNGVLRESDSEGNRIYDFDILTRFDINELDELTTSNFTMFDLIQSNFACKLEDYFDISFIVTNSIPANYLPGELDSLVQTHLIPTSTYMVVSRERFQIRLGHSLTDLWRRNRSVISEASYRRYEFDVPYVWEETVYKRDQYGQIIVVPDGAGGFTYEIEHQKGDPVLDGSGQPVYRYRAGDPILDANGEPELIEPRKILREFMMFLIDGSYYFATEPQSVEYRTLIPDQIVRWINNDVELIQKRLLEQSELYLYPTQTLGDASVFVMSDLRTTIPLEQSLAITYHMPEATFGNYNIREAMTENTHQILTELLSRRTVSVSDIVTRLKASLGDDVVNVDVQGLGGDKNYGVISIDDDSMRLSFRKRLVLLSNQYIAVQDSLTINYLRHSIDS